MSDKHPADLAEPMFWVRVVGTEEDYCLKWGDNSPRWEGTRANAEDRAAKMTATSYDGTRYEAVPACSSIGGPEDCYDIDCPACRAEVSS